MSVRQSPKLQLSRPSTASGGADGPRPGELTEAFWRRRPQSAGVRVTEKLKKITIVVQGETLPSGRTRVSLYPNRFRTMSELYEILNFELKTSEGVPLSLDLTTHAIEMLNQNTGNYELVRDPMTIRDLARLRIVKCGQKSIQSVNGSASFGGASDWGGSGVLGGSTTSPRPSSAFGKLNVSSSSVRNAGSARGGAAAAEKEGGFSIIDQVGSLMMYHAKLVTFLSTKVSVDCEVSNKELDEMELLYEDSAFKLCTNLTHMDPGRAIKVLTQLALQQGKCERGFLDNEELTHLRSALAAERARTTRLQIDLDSCQHDVDVLKQRLDEGAKGSEVRRVEVDSELVSRKNVEGQLLKEVDRLQKLNGALRKQLEEQNQDHQRSAPLRMDLLENSKSNRPSTAPTTNKRHLPPKNQQQQRSPGQSPKRQRPVSGPSADFDFLSSTLRDLSSGLQSPSRQQTDTPPNAPGRGGTCTPPVVPGRASLIDPPSDGGDALEQTVNGAQDRDNFVAAVQFVRLGGQTYTRSVVFSANNIALSSINGLEGYLLKELEKCVAEEAKEKRIALERRGGRRVSEELIQLSGNVRLRTVKDNRMHDIVSNDDAQEFFEQLREAVCGNLDAGVAKFRVPPLLCLEQQKAMRLGSIDFLGSVDSGAMPTSPGQHTGGSHSQGGSPHASANATPTALNTRHADAAKRREGLANAFKKANFQEGPSQTSHHPQQQQHPSKTPKANGWTRLRRIGSVSSASGLKNSSAESQALQEYQKAQAAALLLKKKKAQQVFTGESMSDAAHEEEVMKATWKKLGGGGHKESSDDDDSSGIPAGVLLNYLKGQFDEMGVEGRFERIVKKVLQQQDQAAAEKEAHHASSAHQNHQGKKSSGRSRSPNAMSAAISNHLSTSAVDVNRSQTVDYPHFCMVLLQVCSS